MGPEGGRIQVVHVPIELSLLVLLALQSLQHPIPHPGLLPAVEAARSGPPRTVARGKVAPGGQLRSIQSMPFTTGR
jgi:hypothetical protein